MSARPARVTFLTRRRARRLSDSARAALTRAPVVDDDGRHARTHVVGLDPVRVLLFGSGPLIGYGVTQRRDAVDGHLAELLAERLQRGVTVESRVRLGLPIEQAVGSLGAAGTITFAAAVWAPMFGEELRRFSPRRTRIDVRAMLREFRAESSVPLILCQLPTPLGNDWRTVLRRPRVAEYNRVLAEEAALAAQAVAVPSGAYCPADAATTLDTGWHRQLAERLVPAVLAAVLGSQELRPVRG